MIAPFDYNFAMSKLAPTVEATQTSLPYVPDPEIRRPDTSLLITDDGAAVDNRFVEKQQRLLVEPLYGSWKTDDGRPFQAFANVGLFHAYKEPPNVPDAMLVLDVPAAGDLTDPDNRSYFMWIIGKPPDVVIEVVSDKRGGEDTRKLKHYATIGVTYYVIFDPELALKKGILRAFVLNEGEYIPIDPAKLKLVNLGLKLWDGKYEKAKGRWLRWVDGEGHMIPTTKERADGEQKKADAERTRADKADAKIRELEERLKRLKSNE